MRWIRGLGRLLGAILLVALLIPSLAAWPSALLDRGPAGSSRFSIFPVALTAFDPFVLTCARNSTIVAGLVAIGSLTIGIGLALMTSRWRYWGRGPLWALAMVPLAAGPLLIAPGICLFLGGERGWDWLAARSILGFSSEDVVRWAALIWVGLASGVPLVALATSAALRRVDPAWSEAARAVGASRKRAWREVVWPILRPEAARSASMVFTLTLVEPAGPSFLGLNRTLAAQILNASNRFDQPTRSAALAVLAIAIAALGRTAIVRWGGPSYARSEVVHDLPRTPSGFRRTMLSRLILAGWCFIAVGPVGLLLARSFSAARAASPETWSSMLAGWLSEPEARHWAIVSATTAGLAVAVDLVILATLFRRGRPKSGRAIRAASHVFEIVPPLALGVGALATPWLLEILADSTTGLFRGWLRSLALELSPARSPGLLLVLALAVGRLPMLARAAELSQRLIQPVRIDAARVMGASERRARNAGEGGWLGVVPGRAVFLALVLASTNLAPALLLTPSSERRTLAPAVMEILLEADPIDPRIAGPIAAIFAVNLMALALATKTRVGSIGDWFRG